jgi:hypothetical protein
MNSEEQFQFDKDYNRHVKLLKLQGKAPKTVKSYSHAVRRVSKHFDCHLKELTPDQLQDYFAQLVVSSVRKISLPIIKA